MSARRWVPLLAIGVIACGKHVANKPDAAGDAAVEDDAGMSVLPCVSEIDFVPGWTVDAFARAKAGSYRSNLHKSDGRFGRMRRSQSVQIDGSLSLALSADGSAELQTDLNVTTFHGGGGPICKKGCEGAKGIDGPDGIDAKRAREVCLRGCDESKYGPYPENETWRGSWASAGRCTTVLLHPPRDGGADLLLACALGSAKTDAGTDSASLLVCSTNVAAAASRYAADELATAKAMMSLGRPPKQWMLFGTPVVDLEYGYNNETGTLKRLDLHHP